MLYQGEYAGKMPTLSCQAAWGENYVVLLDILQLAILCMHMVRTVRVLYNRTRIVYTIRVRYKISHRTRTVRTIRVWYVPYAYGTIYAYGIEQLHLILVICHKYLILKRGMDWKTDSQTDWLLQVFNIDFSTVMFSIPFQCTYSTQYRPYTSLRTWLQSFLEAM